MKILVAHPAQQHSFRLAAALARSGDLYKYATTVYYSKGSLTKAVSRLIGSKYRKKAESRRCAELHDEDVVRFYEGEGLLKLLTMNIPLFRPLYRRIKYHVADRFAKKTASYAIKHKVDAVICYDDFSSKLFEILAEKAPRITRIMDASAASILYMRRIYEKDMLIMPENAERLRNERVVVWDKDAIKRAEKEIRLAQHIIAASRFTKNSFVEGGFPAEAISVCPYGVDIELFSPKTDKEFRKKKGPVRFIYVGGVKQLKGIGYLLSAFSGISGDKATLTVVGNTNVGMEGFASCSENVRFIGEVLHEKIPTILKEADVFVYPSLGDGFSLAALEAAACSLPLILSENTGACELICSGREGFTIPIQSAEAIREKIDWFVEHPDRIEPMGRAAREMAERFTWSAYDMSIRKMLSELAENDGSHY